jgi:serine/threonine protein phosphatase PrpC
MGEFEVIAASVIGQGHRHDGTDRQDAYHLLAVEGGVALAIADGVSARPLAAIGAETAVYAAVMDYASATREGAVRGGWDGLIRALSAAVEAADAAIRSVAADLRVKAEELSTTLLIADLRHDSEGRVVVTTAAIGNSSALRIGPGDTLGVIDGPGEGGSPTGYHDFLPGPSGRVRIACSILPAGADLVLVTDGLADDLHASATVRDWMRSRLTHSATPIEFAHALSYRRQGTSDDLTAVAASVAK